MGWSPATAGKITVQEVQARLTKLDADKDGRLSYQELINGYGANQSGRLKQFQKLDKNSSGAIEQTELPKARKFEKLDMNRDGAIGTEEFLIAHSMGMREFVLKTDANKDGFVTSAELGRSVLAVVDKAEASYEDIAAAYMANPGRRQRLFKFLDKDKNGSIEAMEWPDAKSFQAADLNGNSKIGNDEFMNAHATVSHTLILALDTNRDGKISGAEIRRSFKK
jgi:hypothetical protein